MYTVLKKFRGQPVQIAGNRAHITIRTAQPQKDTAPTVGLSDALLAYISKYNITLYVTVEYPKADFKTTAKEWIKGAKKEEQKSYYNIPWYIYRKPIPHEAFEMNKPTKEEVERKHVMQSLGYYG